MQPDTSLTSFGLCADSRLDGYFSGTLTVVWVQASGLERRGLAGAPHRFWLFARILARLDWEASIGKGRPAGMPHTNNPDLVDYNSVGDPIRVQFKGPPCTIIISFEFIQRKFPRMFG